VSTLRVKEGAVRLRGTVWHIRYYDRTGKRREEAAHDVLGCAPWAVKEASDARRALKMRVEQKYQGTLLEPDLRGFLVSDALEQYRTDYLARRGGRVRPRREAQYKDAIRRTGDWFGHLPAATVRWADLKPILDAKRLAGLRDGSIGTHFAILKAALRYCVINGLLPHAPVFPRLPKSPARTRRPTRKESAAVFAAMRPDSLLRDVMGVIEATGWRSGEVLGLKWSRVDLDGPHPVLRLEGVDRKTGEPLMRPIREAAVVRIIQKWKARRRVGVDLVFHHQGGKRYTYEAFLAAWHSACDRAGVVNLLPHDYRRGAYAEAKAAGLDMHDAMELIGHRSLATAQRYMGGGDPERQERNLARLERYRAAVNGAPGISREPGPNGGKMGAIRPIGGAEAE
jgi:integrase